MGLTVTSMEKHRLTQHGEVVASECLIGFRFPKQLNMNLSVLYVIAQDITLFESDIK